MKKATLVLSLLAASTSATWAQSSVTMYGIVDAAVRKTSNAHVGVSDYSVTSSGMSQSRWGININEDLGGGLRAIANLENRFALDSGATAASLPTGAYWFQSWVGLTSRDFGTVTLGRQYNVLFDLNASTFSSFKYSTYIDLYKPELVMTMDSRQDNMVKYRLDAGPVTAELQVSAGEGTGTSGAIDKSAGGAIKYNAGAFAFGAGYQETTGNNVVSTLGAANTAALGTSIGKKAKAGIVGAAYSDGPIYVNLSWMTNRFDQGALSLSTIYTLSLLGSNAVNSSTGDVNKRDMITVGGTYQLTTAVNLGAQYWHMTQTHWYSPGVTSKGDFLAFVADYAFSKRTDAYFEADRTNFTGKDAFDNGATRRYGAMLGLRHRF